MRCNADASTALDEVAGVVALVGRDRAAGSRRIVALEHLVRGLDLGTAVRRPHTHVDDEAVAVLYPLPVAHCRQANSQVSWLSSLPLLSTSPAEGLNSCACGASFRRALKIKPNSSQFHPAEGDRFISQKAVWPDEILSPPPLRDRRIAPLAVGWRSPRLSPDAPPRIRSPRGRGTVGSIRAPWPGRPNAPHSMLLALARAPTAWYYRRTPSSQSRPPANGHPLGPCQTRDQSLEPVTYKHQTVSRRSAR